MALRGRLLWPRAVGENGAGAEGPTGSHREPDSLASALCTGGLTRQHALGQRIETLLAALGHPAPSSSPADLLRAFDDGLIGAGAEEAWLAIAVITGRLPLPSAVLRAVRAIRLDGPAPALHEELRRSGQLTSSSWPQVEVVTNQVLVDVHHTSRARLSTGIQRVTRELARRWNRDHHPIFVGWTEGYESMRRLDDDEIAAACSPSPAGRKPEAAADRTNIRQAPEVLVPWRCTHLVPELPAEPERVRQYQGLVTYSRSVTGVVGYDCVPLTAAETCGEGMAAGFAGYLAAAARLDRVAAISCSAADEYRGWRRMLGSVGQPGPDIEAVPLAVSVPVPSQGDLDEARDLLSVGSLPIVLSVGSHEPRKNHLTLLRAAEALWREGVLFTLALAGGHSWSRGPFDAELERLQRAGRPIQTFVAIPDRLLWAAYRVAYCTVFPSLHEGFGLPVAESLASGTPVITSNYGSMLEGARFGGALLVDPRDPGDLARALRRLLGDHVLHDRLAGEAAKMPLRSWDEYAAEVWAYLVDGRRPGPAGC
jgi:glycosyltransferase involved in cell wall biosynthesis